VHQHDLLIFANPLSRDHMSSELWHELMQPYPRRSLPYIDRGQNGNGYSISPFDRAGLARTLRLLPYAIAKNEGLVPELLHSLQEYSQDNPGSASDFSTLRCISSARQRAGEISLLIIRLRMGGSCRTIHFHHQITRAACY
jgi:hypothetical protein